jgi:uncharacterized protein YkwD
VKRVSARPTSQERYIFAGRHFGGPQAVPCVPHQTGIARRVFGALAAAAILLCCILPTAVSAARTAQDFTVAANEYDAFLLLNQQRTANGMGQLRLNSALTTAARAYAMRMAQENFLSHTSPDGGTLAQRIDAVPYPLPVWEGEALSAYGPDPTNSVNGLMISPVHRAVLLDARLTDVGIGYSGELSAGVGPRWVFNLASSATTPIPEVVVTGTPGAVPSTPQSTPIPTAGAGAHRVYLPDVQR